MKRLIFLLIFSAGVNPKVSLAQSYEYPETRIESVIDTFHTHYIVEDKYRWLENVESEEVKDWIKKQNKLSDKYLLKAGTKYNVAEWIKLYSKVEYNFPVKKGKYYFNLGSQTIYYRKSFDGNPILLVSIGNSLGKDILEIENFSVSHDSKLLAYQYSRNGSDRMELKVISIASGFHKKDHLMNLRFGQTIAWRGDGFYYSKYVDNGYYEPLPKQEVYYHKIGTEQSEDVLIFKRDNPEAYFAYYTLDNGRYFILYDMNSKWETMNIYFIDYNSDNPVITPLLVNHELNTGIIGVHNEKFVAMTNYNAKNGCVVEIDPHESYKWTMLVPEFGDAEIMNAIAKENKIFIQFKSGITCYIGVYNYLGEFLVKLELPPFSSVGKFSSGEDEDELIYSYTSYTIPNVVHKLNTKTYEDNNLDVTKINFDYTTIEYKQIEYLSKDSVLVPMTLVYEKGLDLNGNNPAILYTYGGYGDIEEPSFDPGIVYFVKQGGVFAFAHVRGSGEKGEEWAKQGARLNKQNTFDDFASAAEYLINENYTNAEKLAATGGSHGGLVVAAAAIQRPDLFKVVVPVVAPLDMLRLELFTVGQENSDEFGSVKDSMEFKNLFSYSPYHNIKEDINYPSMLIMTSEFDDRVPPFNSYKFTASLQNRSAQINPVYLSVQEKAGHSGTSDINMYMFIISQLIKKEK